MTNLTETAEWELGVRQIETTDQVMGGPGGIANAQAQQLANRTAWLKALLTPCITGGTASAYTLTPDVPLAANAAWARYPVIFALAGEGNPTLAVSGQPALPLVFRDAGGNLVSCLPSADLFSDVVCDGSHWIVLDPPPVNLATPGPIGGSTPAPVTGTVVTATDRFNGPGTGLTGNALDLVAGSSNQLKGKTWEEPGTIGSTTPAPIAGTTITATDQFKGPGTGLTGTASAFTAGSSNQLKGKTWEEPNPIGSTTPAPVTGTTITATSQFSGPGAGLTGTAASLTAGSANSVPWSGITGKPNVSALSWQWNWGGQLGQPSWLWGGNDGSTMQVYNPENFSVNRANSAGSVDTIRVWCFACPITRIVAGFNISSVTNPSGLQYSFNFATAMPDSNYAAWGQEFTNGSDSSYDFTELRNKTASGVTFVWHGSGGGGITPAGASILVMR